jgi:hypothetical protein
MKTLRWSVEEGAGERLGDTRTVAPGEAPPGAPYVPVMQYDAALLRAFSPLAAH